MTVIVIFIVIVIFVIVVVMLLHFSIEAHFFATSSTGAIIPNSYHDGKGKSRCLRIVA